MASTFFLLVSLVRICQGRLSQQEYPAPVFVCKQIRISAAVFVNMGHVENQLTLGLCTCGENMPILTSGENLLVPAFVLKHIQLLDFISKAHFAPTRALYD